MSTIQRKLASIQKIAWLAPIEGADLIELAGINGWQCIVKKGEFKVGDFGIYYEIDSFLPLESTYDFLGERSVRTVEGLGTGYRIKTMKMKGQLSQGLLLPLTAIQNVSFQWLGSSMNLVEGQDVTEVLGVKKWELPESGCVRAGNPKSNWPSFLQKTDQERAQNCLPAMLFQPDSWEATLKLDGSSMTCFVNEDENGSPYVGVCSRNVYLDLDNNEGNAFVDTFKKLGIGELLLHAYEELKIPIALQGELMGPGVQGNREKLPELDYYVFDIFNIHQKSYISPDARNVVLDKYFPSLKKVPTINKTFKLGGMNIHQLLEWVEGPSINHPIREGVVFKNHMKRVSFKCISNKYLLKEK